MRRNIAGQTVGAQMVSASNNTAFTGAVTVYVTKDGGTQALGSVGSGACVHKGNGYHVYAPAKVETDCDIVAFTFIGTGAKPETRELYPEVSMLLLTGVATGGSTTTAIFPVGASTLNSQYNGNFVIFEDDQSAFITDWDGVNITATFDRTFTSTRDGLRFAMFGFGATPVSDPATVEGQDEILDNIAASQNILQEDIVNSKAEILADVRNPPDTATGVIADRALGRNIAGGSDGGRTVTSALRAQRNKVLIDTNTMKLTVYEEDDVTIAWTANLTLTSSSKQITAIDPV